MKLVPPDFKVTNRDSLFYALYNYKGKVLYGIPKETNASRDDIDKEAEKGIGNADILAIQENGSLVNNLPARPLLIPVAEKHSKEIDDYMSRVIDALLAGKPEKADSIMKRLAFNMERWTKAYFVEKDKNPKWEPNSPATIKGKKSSQPLIDTGDLRRAIKGVFTKQ